MPRKPLFTLAHYNFLARLFGREIDVADALADTSRMETLKGMARLLTRELEHDNPKFDGQQFLKACGVPDWTHWRRQP